MGLSEEESDISPDRPGRVIQNQDSPNGADFSQRIVDLRLLGYDQTQPLFPSVLLDIVTV